MPLGVLMKVKTVQIEEIFLKCWLFECASKSVFKLLLASVYGGSDNSELRIVAYNPQSPVPNM